MNVKEVSQNINRIIRYIQGFLEKSRGSVFYACGNQSDHSRQVLPEKVPEISAKERKKIIDILNNISFFQIAEMLSLGLGVPL